MEEETAERPKDTEEIRKLLTSKNLLIGERSVMKQLQKGKIRKVFIAKNCKASVRKDVMRSQDIAKVAVATLDVNNEDLGVICKKPYAVSIIGVLA